MEWWGGVGERFLPKYYDQIIDILVNILIFERESRVLSTFRFKRVLEFDIFEAQDIGFLTASSWAEPHAL